MNEIHLLQEAYRKLGRLFLTAARQADAEAVAEVRNGTAQAFWEEEIKHALYPLTLKEEKDD